MGLELATGSQHQTGTIRHDPGLIIRALPECDLVLVHHWTVDESRRALLAHDGRDLDLAVRAPIDL